MYKIHVGFVTNANRRGTKPLAKQVLHNSSTSSTVPLNGALDTLMDKTLLFCIQILLNLTLYLTSTVHMTTLTSPVNEKRQWRRKVA